MHTIRGQMAEADLLRTVQFTDRPGEFTVTVEWHAKDTGELVRRDAHIILKEPSVVADALASSVGG